MIRPTYSFNLGLVDRFERHSIQRLERAAMRATARAGGNALREIRPPLGRLGNGLKLFSDLEKGSVYRDGSEGFSASAGVAIRTRNERTVGAIESYTEGAEILPVKGRYLWFPTDELGIKRIGRRKVTPSLYRAAGLDKRIGPLIQIRGNHPGEAFLIVRNVSTRAAGGGRPRRLAKSGRASAGRVAQDFIIAFIGIRRTSRQQKVDVREIMRRNAKTVGPLIATEMRKGG